MSLCEKDDIQQGDAFLSIDGVPISELIEQRQRYVIGSNNSKIMEKIKYIILRGSTDSVKVKYERNGEIGEKCVHRYTLEKLNFKKDSIKNLPKFEILKNNIGYVNMGLLMQEDVKKTMESLKNTKAIIFDSRNYPNSTVFMIAEYLNKEEKEFEKDLIADLSYPGVFQYEKPQKCGKKNAKYYKGKVVVLFNESTQSQAEFTVMAFQTAPNVKCIGSQTSGADGSVSIIMFPGNLQTKMSGAGVYYPDGRQTQRIGIVPDIEVKPTIKGIKEGRDEVFDKAIEYIEKN